MGDTISYNPAELATIHESFTKFNGEIAESDSNIRGIMQLFEESWKGPESEAAQEKFDEIKKDLDIIREDFETQEKFVDRQAKDFADITIRF